MIVAFKYESHVTGHQIYDEIITYKTKMQGLCEVHYSFWPDISTGEYIFVSFTNCHSSFDAHLVSR